MQGAFLRLERFQGHLTTQPRLPFSPSPPFLLSLRTGRGAGRRPKSCVLQNIPGAAWGNLAPEQ